MLRKWLFGTLFLLFGFAVHAQAPLPLILGETVVGEVTADGTTQHLFEAQQGDFLIIHVETQDFQPWIGIINPDGISFANNGDGNIGGFLDSVMPFTVPEDGQYFVEVRDWTGSTGGEYTLTVLPSQIIPLSEGETVEVEFDGATPAAYFSFDGPTYRVFRISAVSDGSIDTVLGIYHDGFNVALDDNSGENNDPLIDSFPLFQGQYTIELRPLLEMNAQGRVAVTVELAQLPSLDDGTWQPVTNLGSFFVFTAEAGAVYRLNYRLSGTGKVDTGINIGGRALGFNSFNNVSQVTMTFTALLSGEGLVQIIKEFQEEPLEISLTRVE